jgi:hypothetical protein
MRTRKGYGEYPTRAGDIDYTNSIVVEADKDGNVIGWSSLQAAYDWLASSDRDGEMGALSSTNKRYLIGMAANYNGAILDESTDNVEFVEQIIGTCINLIIT